MDCDVDQQSSTKGTFSPFFIIDFSERRRTMQNIRSITRINKAYLFYSLVCASLVMGMQPVLLGQVSPSVYFFRSDLRFTTVTTEDGNIYEKVFITDKLMS
jgi:hypothetical protein